MGRLMSWGVYSKEKVKCPSQSKKANASFTLPNLFSKVKSVTGCSFGLMHFVMIGQLKMQYNPQELRTLENIGFSFSKLSEY